MEIMEFILAGIGILSILITLVAGVLYVLGFIDLMKELEKRITRLFTQIERIDDNGIADHGRILDLRVRVERLEEKKKN